MNVIKGSCIRVSQPIGDFYCSVFKARDLYDISYSDVRRLEDEQDGEGLDTYLGIQRELSPFELNKSENTLLLWMRLFQTPSLWLLAKNM